MKNGIHDLYFVLAATLIATCSCLLTMLLTPYVHTIFGDYYTIVNVFLSVSYYGILSAMVIRTSVFFFPLTPGSYSMDTGTFYYWKTLILICIFGKAAMAPLLGLVCTNHFREQLFGAKLGKNTSVGGDISDPFMVTVGHNSVLGNCIVSGYHIEGGTLHIGRVTVGNNVTVAPFCVIYSSTIGDNVILLAGSVVIPGTVVPSDISIRGNPARQWRQR